MRIFTSNEEKKEKMPKNGKKRKKTVWEHGSNFFNGVKFFLIQNGFLSNEALKNIRVLSDTFVNYDQYQNLINLLDQTSSKI